jgi:hypothetical protein
MHEFSSNSNLRCHSHAYPWTASHASPSRCYTHEDHTISYKTHTHTHTLSLSLSLSLLSLFSLHSTRSNLCRNKNSRRHTYRAFSSSLTSIQPRLQQQQGWRHGQTVCPELPLSVCLSLYLHTKNLKCNNTNKDAAVPSGYFWVSDPGSLSSSA